MRRPSIPVLADRAGDDAPRSTRARRDQRPPLPPPPGVGAVVKEILTTGIKNIGSRCSKISRY